MTNRTAGNEPLQAAKLVCMWMITTITLSYVAIKLTTRNQSLMVAITLHTDGEVGFEFPNGTQALLTINSKNSSPSLVQNPVRFEPTSNLRSWSRAQIWSKHFYNDKKRTIYMFMGCRSGSTVMTLAILDSLGEFGFRIKKSFVARPTLFEQALTRFQENSKSISVI